MNNDDLGKNLFTPPPWPLTEENRSKTEGWCEHQDYLREKKLVSAKELATQFVNLMEGLYRSRKEKEGITLILMEKFKEYIIDDLDQR